MPPRAGAAAPATLPQRKTSGTLQTGSVARLRARTPDGKTCGSSGSSASAGIPFGKLQKVASYGAGPFVHRWESQPGP